MDRDVHIIRRVLRTTALCGVLAVLATPAYAQTFDPNGTTDSSGAALADASSFDPAAIPPTPAKPIGKTIETTLTTGTQRLGGEPMSLLSANAAAAAPSTGTAPPPVPPFASVIPSPILSPFASTGVPLAGVRGNPSEDPEVPQDPKTVFVAPPVIPPAKPVVIAQPAAAAPAPLALSQPVAGQPVALESPAVAAPVVAAPTVIAAPPPPLVPEAKPVVVAQPAPAVVAPKPVVVAEPAVVPPAPPAPVIVAAKPIVPAQPPVIAEATPVAAPAPKPVALVQPTVVVAKPVSPEPSAPKLPEQPPAVVAKPAVAEAPVVVAKQTTIAPKPHFPPVDPAVSAEAEREMKAKPSAYIAPLPTFAAPAPLTKQEPAPAIVAPVAAAPVAVKQVAVAPAPTAPVPAAPVFVKPAAPAPVAASASVGAVAPEATAPSVGAAAPQAATEASSSTAEPALSADSKAILRKLPAKLNNIKPAAGGKLNVSRMSPDVKPLNEDKDKIQSYDAVGLSIKVARPGLDTNFELNRAYTALMGGDTEAAIATYKNILTSEPQNQDALFGLAATYHRTGQLDKARPYYGQLLKVNPSHREGLNNFLALVSEESPNEALVELERLEQNNPDFSPIPAQEAMVFSKLGYFDQARDKLLRAIELAPDNMTYKYNLAILFDRHGDYASAAALYRLLIDASLKGEKLPASTDTLQTRLNYITAASAPH